MAGKMSLLVAMGAGYVLGARSGRERYDQIVNKAQQVWQDPRVQDAADKVQHAAQEAADRSGHHGQPGQDGPR